MDITLLLTYNLTAFYTLGYPTQVLAAHDIYIISANLIGGAAGYLTERHRRLLFLREDQLENLNGRLEKIVQEKVTELRTKDKILLHQSKMAAMGEMINSIAHQLKQPLTTIGITIERIVDAYTYKEMDDQTVKDFHQAGHEQIMYMSRTIDDFRDYFNPNKQKTDYPLRNLVEKTAKLLQLPYQTHRIKLVTEIDDVMIHGLERELQQVLINIANNAKDALNERNLSGGEVRIYTILNRADRKVHICIEDNAGGIPKEIADKIFTSYFSTKGDKGTGIGLSIAKMLVENEGGTLHLENYETGARFVITLPYLPI